MARLPPGAQRGVPTLARARQCRLMAEQASTKGILGEAAAFFRAAQTWKVGTDTNSGADHNCHAFGFCGPVSHSFLLSLKEKRALASAAADAAARCNGTCDRRPEELVRWLHRFPRLRLWYLR